MCFFEAFHLLDGTRPSETSLSRTKRGRHGAALQA